MVFCVLSTVTWIRFEAQPQLNHWHFCVCQFPVGNKIRSSGPTFELYLLTVPRKKSWSGFLALGSSITIWQWTMSTTISAFFYLLVESTFYCWKSLKMVSKQILKKSFNIFIIKILFSPLYLVLKSSYSKTVSVEFEIFVSTVVYLPRHSFFFCFFSNTVYLFYPRFSIFVFFCHSRFKNFFLSVSSDILHTCQNYPS